LEGQNFFSREWKFQSLTKRSTRNLRNGLGRETSSLTAERVAERDGISLKEGLSYLREKEDRTEVIMRSSTDLTSERTLHFPLSARRALTERR